MRGVDRRVTAPAPQRPVGPRCPTSQPRLLERGQRPFLARSPLGRFHCWPPLRCWATQASRASWSNRMYLPKRRCGTSPRWAARYSQDLGSLSRAAASSAVSKRRNAYQPVVVMIQPPEPPEPPDLAQPCGYCPGGWAVGGWMPGGCRRLPPGLHPLVHAGLGGVGGVGGSLRTCTCQPPGARLVVGVGLLNPDPHGRQVRLQPPQPPAQPAGCPRP